MKVYQLNEIRQEGGETFYMRTPCYFFPLERKIETPLKTYRLPESIDFKFDEIELILSVSTPILESEKDAESSGKNRWLIMEEMKPSVFAAV